MIVVSSSSPRSAKDEVNCLIVVNPAYDFHFISLLLSRLFYSPSWDNICKAFRSRITTTGLVKKVGQ